MGEVYLVENVDLQKQLVIKVLLPERSSNAELVERFLAEARAASAIRHRHIVEILDSSTLSDGRPYILMEFLEGETLFSFSQRRGIVSPDITLAIMSQVCSGLQAAHERGVIHRDVKPSNIFIAPQPDNQYFTKVLDFGIAKLEDPRLAGGVHTRSVMIAGTPHYMSPEQARTLHGVDQRTDIYAVGVMAYELLTGRVPYDAHSIGELVFQQARSIPPMVHELRPDLPRAWSDVLAQAMAIEPDERPTSARELAMLMIAATGDGTRIAKEAAPLLFTRGVTSSGQVGVPLSEVEAQVSEIRSEPPRRRSRVLAASPRPATGRRFGTGVGGRQSSHGVRKTEVLPEGARQTAAQAIAEAETKRRPKLDMGPVGSAPPAMPGSSQSSTYTGERERPTTTGVGERKRKRSGVRWLIIGLVLAASIGAAVAIGLFTGPQKLGDEGTEPGAGPGTAPIRIDAGVDAR